MLNLVPTPDFFTEKQSEENNGYIFISHSHKDKKAVHEIRNYLEAYNFDALCFFLKCLNDDSEELTSLIKREIDAREWFLYVDSENARNAKWVKKELDYIRSKPNRRILKVDLENKARVENVLNLMLHNLRIFVTYAHSDHVIAKRICDKLREKGYFILLDEGTDYTYDVTKDINPAAKSGCVLALISGAFLQTENCFDELMYAVKKRANILPVFLGQPNLAANKDVFFTVGNIQGIFLPENPDDGALDDLVEQIGSYIMEKYRDVIEETANGGADENK